MRVGQPAQHTSPLSRHAPDVPSVKAVLGRVDVVYRSRGWRPRVKWWWCLGLAPFLLHQGALGLVPVGEVHVIDPTIPIRDGRSSLGLQKWTDLGRAEPLPPFFRTVSTVRARYNEVGASGRDAS